MKLSVGLFVVLVASVCANNEAEPPTKRTMKMYKQCFKESGTTPEELRACETQKKDCPKGNCYLACIMREMGFIDKDGNVNTKVIEHMVSELPKAGHPKQSAAMKKCFLKPHKKRSFCDAARALQDCMLKEPYD